MLRSLGKALSVLSMIVAFAVATPMSIAPAAAAASVGNAKATRQLFQVIYAHDMTAVIAVSSTGADVEARDRWGSPPPRWRSRRGNPPNRSLPRIRPQHPSRPGACLGPSGRIPSPGRPRRRPRPASLRRRRRSQHRCRPPRIVQRRSWLQAGVRRSGRCRRRPEGARAAESLRPGCSRLRLAVAANRRHDRALDAPLSSAGAGGPTPGPAASGRGTLDGRGDAHPALRGAGGRRSGPPSSPEQHR